MFALDDTTTLKCKKIRDELLDNKFLVIYDDLQNRNGSAIFEGKNDL